VGLFHEPSSLAASPLKNGLSICTYFKLSIVLLSTGITVTRARSGYHIPQPACLRPGQARYRSKLSTRGGGNRCYPPRRVRALPVGHPCTLLFPWPPDRFRATLSYSILHTLTPPSTLRQRMVIFLSFTICREYTAFILR
jgi:hypothetical protein